MNWLIKLIHQPGDRALLEYINPERMKQLEREAAHYGLGARELMENAGKAVAGLVLSRYGRGSRVCVVCGGGNNGGDGFVAARHLAPASEVQVILLVKPGEIRTEEARSNWQALSKVRVKTLVADETSSLVMMSKAIDKAEVIVVAIFGAGVKGRVRKPASTAISMINRAKGAKVAVDLPAGLDPSTGAASRPTIRADVTVALHMPKTGLRGREKFTGEIVVAPIGIRRQC